MGIVIKKPTLAKTLRNMRRRKVDTTPKEQFIEAPIEEVIREAVTEAVTESMKDVLKESIKEAFEEIVDDKAVVKEGKGDKE